ncbi:aminoglycoside phosphotransferase family protein [Hirschia maritima]|uniref:aminoglycoside phosphotransferase family protein n=1 Tax=Hirschia maritima TaxID=1121961 RepID=UPI00037780B1|nr:aminoglycoside phosphotransferase family protein [Hirschia maritima]
MNNKLRVLYVDDSNSDLESYGKIWKQLLADQGFEDIDLRTSLKFDLTEVDDQLPHLVIADNVLLDSESNVELDNEGAHFIADLKKKYDHIVAVLFTHATFSIKTLGQLTPNPDLLIPKNHFRSINYRNEWIGPKLKNLLSRRPIGNLNFVTPKLMTEYKDMADGISCILEQCLNDVTYYESNAAAQIKLSKLTGGVSGASVFLMQIAGIERFQNVPLVFRISQNRFIREEVQNYKRFVSLQVPHDLRVELVGFGEHLDSAGALYAFALADVEHTTTALALLKESSKDRQEKLEEILKKIFDRANLGWYNNDSNGSMKLVEYFSQKEEYDQKKDHRRIRGISKNLIKFKIEGFEINGDYISNQDFRLQLPRNIMDKLGDLEIPLAVVHGDLNLNNIIVSKADLRIALIDFEYCGVDHLFKDSVSLEVSSLALLQKFNNFDVAFDFFRKKHSVSNVWEKNPDLIQTIRYLAISQEDKKLDCSELVYLLCLSFHLFKVAALENLERDHFVSMLGSLCAALETLNNSLEA